MTILSCDEVWRGESGSDETGGKRKYVRRFLLQSDTATETFTNVRAALPTGAHPDDASAFLSGRSMSRSDSSRLIWDAEINYETEANDPGDDPTDRPPKIRWTSSMVLRPVVRDLNGTACVNSAGDYFDPPLEMELPRWTVTIQFNAATIPAGISSYRGAVNVASITIEGETFVAGRARVIGLDIGEEDEENDIPFRSITLVVECREAEDDGFDIEPLDQGFRTIKTDPEDAELSARTSDVVGELTMDSGAHGITTGSYFNMRWENGNRVGVKAGTVSGTTVPFSLGTGYALPGSLGTDITVTQPQLQDILIEDEDGTKARPTSPVLLNGKGQKLDFATDGPGVFGYFVMTRKLDLTIFPGIT